MPYYLTCYDTTVGKIEKLKSLDQSLREAMVTGDLQERRLGVEKVDENTAIFVIGGTSAEMNIPAFVHPYLIQNYKGRNYLATDARLFRTTAKDYYSERDFEADVRNKVEYSLMKTRAALSLMWLSKDVERLRARFNFAASVFATWLSQAIGRAYALDFQDQAMITAVGVYYYYSLFTEARKLEGNDLEVAVVHTIKVTKLPGLEVYKLFESLGEIRGIEDYCQEVKKVVQNVRLNDFNLGMLLTLVRNSWYGTNAKEMIAVALEHPPTWITIVYATMTERTYKTSNLYKVLEFLAKRGNGDEFKMNFLDLLRERVFAVEEVDNGPGLVFKDFED